MVSSSVLAALGPSMTSGTLPVMDVSPADWAAIAAAVFTAIAAGAAWRTVTLDHKRQREARRPNVAAGFGVTPSLIGSVTFVNAGPGLAIALAYVAVTEGRTVRGYVGNGMLAAGQDAKVDLGPVGTRKGRGTVVWICYDIDGNEHLWSLDQRHRLASREEVLARGESYSIDEAFRAMYPNVAIP